MFVGQFLQSTVMMMLSGVLALSNGFAPFTGVADATPEQQPTPQERSLERAADQTTLARVDSHYETDRVIPQILIENAAYQQAAVSASGMNILSEAVRSTSTPQRIADALVNIYCQYRTDEYERTTTGTGFFVHQSGVVLTNAHVAQFLLFEGVDSVHNTHCVLRAGNPARPLYEAKLLYISPAWINENAELIEANDPTGTGERDYALLYASATVGSSTLPTIFPALPIDTSLLSKNATGATVFAGGYPAEALEETGPDTKLSLRVSSTTIGELYTFGSNYADIFAVAGSKVGGRGSSGGPVTRENGDVIGLIVTKGENAEGARSLRALTLSYIDRTIQEETGFSLQRNITGDLERRSRIFKEALAPFLSRILTHNLK